MKEQSRKFLKILKIELEDLEEDIICLEELYKDRENRGEISHYVLLENSTLLKNEQSAIQNIIASLAEFDISGSGDLQELTAKLETHLSETIKKYNYPDSVFIFVKRRLYKVKKYMEEVV